MRLKILRAKDSTETGGGTPPEPSFELENLRRENAELREANKALAESRKVAGGLTPDQEKFVKERMAVGLTREQALEVLRSQEAWDKELAKQEKASKK